MENICIIGSKNIATIVGRKWINSGFPVTYGVRNINSENTIKLLKTLDDKANITNVETAILSSKIVLIAIPGTEIENFINKYKTELENKIILDAVNKIHEPILNNIKLYQTNVIASKVYRVFNNYGWEIFQNGLYKNIQADLIYCGCYDDYSNKLIEELIISVGLNPVNIGGIEKVDIIDNLLKLWGALAIENKMGREIAFKILKK